MGDLKYVVSAIKTGAGNACPNIGDGTHEKDTQAGAIDACASTKGTCIAAGKKASATAACVNSNCAGSWVEDTTCDADAQKKDLKYVVSAIKTGAGNACPNIGDGTHEKDTQ